VKRVTGVFIGIIMLCMIHAVSARGENLSGNALLSEADIQKIKKTGIALVIPIYIPEGFTLNKVDVKFDKHVFSYSIDSKEAVRIAESLRYMDSSSQAPGESSGKVDISGTRRSSTGATINISPYGEADRFQIKA